MKNKNKQFIIFLILPMFFLSFMFLEMSKAAMLVIAAEAESVTTNEKVREIIQLKLIDDRLTLELENKEALKFCDLDFVSCDNEIERMIADHADKRKLNVPLMQRIAWCESAYNPQAKNKLSTASGVYQFLKSTWKNNKCQGDVFNAEDNIICALDIIKQHGTSRWNESKKCWG